jgi:hypothetical protein
MKTNDQYASYLLRLWFNEQHDRWRFLLHSVQSGSEYQFNSLDHMVQFLESQMNAFPEDEHNNQGVFTS